MEYVLGEEKQASFASSLQRDRLRALLNNSSTPATVLLVICVDHFGMEGVSEWEPSTLWSELKAELDADLPPVNRDKIQALLTYLTTDQFFRQLPVFISICNVLSDTPADFEEFDPATTDEMVYALAELYALQPFKTDEFAEDIRSYAGLMMREEGMVKAPKILEWARMPADTGERLDMFQDDPPFFNAIWDKQHKDQADMLEHTKKRLDSMVVILKTMPMLHGNAEKLKA